MLTWSSPHSYLVKWVTGSPLPNGTFAPRASGVAEWGLGYAAKVWQAAGGRQVLYSWLVGAAPANAPWVGAQSLPRQVGVRADGTLTLQPVTELSGLARGANHSFSALISNGGRSSAVNVSAQSLLVMTATATGTTTATGSLLNSRFNSSLKSSFKERFKEGLEEGQPRRNYGGQAGKAPCGVGEVDYANEVLEAGEGGVASFGVTVGGLSVQINVVVGACGVTSATMQAGRVCCAPLSRLSNSSNGSGTWQLRLQTELWIDRFILEAYAQQGAAVVTTTLGGRPNASAPLVTTVYASAGVNVSFDVAWIELATAIP